MHPGRLELEELWLASRAVSQVDREMSKVCQTFRNVAGPAVLGGLRSSMAARIAGEGLLIRSNGVPDYEPSSWVGFSRSGRWDGNPNSVAAQDYLFYLPLRPGQLLATSIPVPLGPIGLAANGVPLYDYRTGGAGDAILEESFDSCCGHPDGRSRYHYHQFPRCVRGATSLGQLVATDTASVAAALADQLRRDLPSPPVGCAFDGHPVMGPVGPGADGTVRFLRSSYKGRVYVPGFGDLDECNGRTGPDGVYRYYCTVRLEAADVVPTFPYLPPAYRSRPDPRNFHPHALFAMGLAGPPRWLS